MTAGPSAPPGGRRAVLLAVAVVAVSLNLRAAVASVGPVLGRIQAGLPLSDGLAAALTALPVLCFGALAGLGLYLSRRFGVRGALAVLTGAVCTGLVLRSGPDAATLFAGTVVAAGGIAGANVVIPALIKHDFPRRTGLLMGLYTTAVTASAAAGAGLTVPLGHAVGGGWRASLGIWAAPAGLALALWATQLRGAPAYGVALARRTGASLLRNRLAWMVTLYFALQSLTFYSVLEWLPSLYQSHGYSPELSGALLSVGAVLQLPASLAVPALATRMTHQGRLVVASSALTAAGLAGILLAPTSAALVWLTLLGLGQGSSFPLALTLVVLRSESTAETTQLSAMAQSAGYLIAAGGPALIGLLHSASGGWTLPVAALIAAMLPQTLTGVRAGRPGSVGSGAPQVPRAESALRTTPGR